MVYFVSYKLISKYQRDELKDPTSSLFRVVGLLVSLMLSLAFSEVIAEVRVIRTAVEREAVAISDTFTNLELFDNAQAIVEQGHIGGDVSAEDDSTVTILGGSYGLGRSLVALDNALITIVGSGLQSLLFAVPGVAPVVTLFAALYFAYLAYRIATAPPLKADADPAQAPRGVEHVLPEPVAGVSAAMLGALPPGAVGRLKLAQVLDGGVGPAHTPG